MNSARDYADAVFTGRRRAFWRTLRPLSLGHCTLLSQLENPWIEGRADLADCSRCLEAAAVCSMPWDRAAEAVRRSMNLRTLAWVWCAASVSAVNGSWYLRQIAELAEYFADNLAAPALKRRGGSDGVGGGIPAWALMKTLAQKELHMSAEAAMDATPSSLLWGLSASAGAANPDAWMDEDDASLIEEAQRMREEAVRGN